MREGPERNCDTGGWVPWVPTSGSPDRVGSARDGRGLINESGAWAAQNYDDAFAADGTYLSQAVQVLLFLLLYTKSGVIDRAFVLQDCRTSGLTEVEHAWLIGSARLIRYMLLGGNRTSCTESLSTTGTMCCQLRERLPLSLVPAAVPRLAWYTHRGAA